MNLILKIIYAKNVLFSHVFDNTNDNNCVYSIDLSKLPHWRSHMCGGFPLYNIISKIIKNSIKNINSNKNEYYILIAPNFYNNKFELKYIL